MNYMRKHSELVLQILSECHLFEPQILVEELSPKSKSSWIRQSQRFSFSSRKRGVSDAVNMNDLKTNHIQKVSYMTETIFI